MSEERKNDVTDNGSDIKETDNRHTPRDDSGISSFNRRGFEYHRDALSREPAPSTKKMSFMDRLKSDKKFRFKFMGISAAVLAVAVVSFVYLSSMSEYVSADKKQIDAEAMVSQAIEENKVDKSSENETTVSFDEVMTESEYDSEYAYSSGRTYGDYLEELKGIKEHKTDPLLYERINFDKLTNIVPQDVAGWLYIPDTNVDYIVMHGDEEDPYKYLWKDPYGNKSSTGSLFVKYESDAEEKDDHTIIYGHRLKDHSLYFGALLQYRDENFTKEHDVCYYYTKDRVTRYKLYSVNEGLETDMVYLYPYTINTPDYEWLIDDVNKYSSVKPDADAEYDPSHRMLVLSTCSGEMGGMPNRLYLVFEEDCYWEYQ